MTREKFAQSGFSNAILGILLGGGFLLWGTYGFIMTAVILCFVAALICFAAAAFGKCPDD